MAVNRSEVALPTWINSSGWDIRCLSALLKSIFTDIRQLFVDEASIKAQMKNKSRIITYTGVALVALGVTWAITLSVVKTDRLNRLAQGEKRAKELVTFFEADSLKILTIADNIIREARREYLQQQTAERIVSFYEEAVPHNDYVSYLLLLNANGEIEAQTSGYYSKEPLASKPFFKALRDTSDDIIQVTASDPGHATGRLTLGVARRITLQDGSFGGVVVAGINAEEMIDFLNALTLGPNSSATLIGLDRHIRASSSYRADGPGQDTSGSRLWSAFEQSSVGQFWETNSFDGVSRTYAYRRVADHPLLVRIGLAKQDLLVGTQAFSQPLFAIASLISIVVIVLTTMLYYAELARKRLQKQIAVRRQAEEKLEAANSDLVQFAFAASHDLKAPLSSIRGLLEFCVEDLIDGDIQEVNSNLNHAIGISIRAADKVQGLLRLANSADIEIEQEQIPLKDMIRDIWVDQSSLVDEHCHLDIKTTGSEHFITEKATLQAILENLISNALRYRDPQKPETLVTVETDISDARCQLVVRDNGVGIAERDQESVFQMFARADDRSGHGLGLALVKKYVERLNGQIILQSTKGIGSEFILKFKNHRETSA